MKERTNIHLECKFGSIYDLHILFKILWEINLNVSFDFSIVFWQQWIFHATGQIKNSIDCSMLSLEWQLL